MNMQSEQINELAEALSKAQGLIEGAAKDSKNPFFKSSYADLHSVMACAKEPLASNGLSVVQPTATIDGQLCLVTMLMHKSGQWLKSIMPIVLVKQDAQSVGSALTYFRRYCYSSLIGISSIDDDGEAAMERKPKEAKPVVKNEARAPTINDLYEDVSNHDVVVIGELQSYMEFLREKHSTTDAAIISSYFKSDEQKDKFRKSLMKFIQEPAVTIKPF